MNIEVSQDPQLVPGGNLTINSQPQKKSNLVTVLLFLLVLFLVGSGGFILAKYLYTPKTQVPVSSQPSVGTSTPTQSPLSTPSASTPTYETANWKSYSNEYHKFQFKYPQTWKLEAVSEDKSLNLRLISDEVIGTEEPMFGDGESVPLKFLFNINNVDNSGGLSFPDLMTQGSHLYLKGNLKYISKTIGNYTAYFTDQLSISPLQTYQVFITNGGASYIEFEMYPYNPDSSWQYEKYRAKYMTLIDQILSTFKFL